MMAPSDIEGDWRRMTTAFSQYIRLERGLAANSHTAYMNDLHHLSTYCCEHCIEPAAVAADDMAALISDMNATGIAVASQCRMISGWRVFFNMLLAEGDISVNPATLLPMPQRGKRLPDVLTDADITALQATFDRSLPDQDRNYVIVEVLYGCGLRVSELVTMHLSNIYADEECLRITGKGSKERWVPINRHALRLLTDYIHLTRSHLTPRKGEETYVFLNRLGTHLSRNYVFMFIKQAALNAGIAKHVSPHSLRHSFATELVQNGADLRAVQEMLGHASLATTEIYTHLDTSFLRRTIETCHPHYR